jgi:hypothetical protein
MGLVDDQPAVRDIDAKLAALEQQRADFEARVAPIAAEDEAAEERYRQALDAALLTGAPMPDPPVRRLPQGRDVEIRLNFMDEQQRLTEERRQAVANAYDDVLRQARREAAKLLKGARPTVEKLGPPWKAVGELLQAVQICRNAGNGSDPTQERRTFHDQRLTFDTFIRFVASGGDPIDLVDLTGAPRPESQPPPLTWGEVARLIEETQVRA